MENEYNELSYEDKKVVIREYAIKDEIKDCVNFISDEIDSAMQNCYIHLGANPIKYQEKCTPIFNKILNKIPVNDGISLWQMIKDFLIDGYIALEIVWSEDKKTIIGFNKLNHSSLIPSNDKILGNYWIMYPNDPILKRLLLDSQVIFIKYSDTELSYVESLIKPYNTLKIMEQTAILTAIKDATVHQKITIPIKGLSKQRAEEQIGQIIANYSEHIEFNDLGELTINGSKHLPYNKQYWFPDGDMGTPQMQHLSSPVNHNPNQLGLLKYFSDKLKKAGYVPSEDKEEIRRFNKFLFRLRANLKEIILKPLKLQIYAEYPDLLNDKDFHIDITFS